ncbi:MAG: 4-hydroxy-3-methylbut-2-enyl diphosphate reductase [Candidatus Margulisbacteria bacterium GWF2_35_9]|nr:MAG: 4-hydroxy-3-methylbut-2-enyl diphosphate reductase [Candidatus Margulisbacteria bacterium GWF2_35_9]
MEKDHNVKTLFLANPRGFCSGVTRAINTVNKVIAEHTAPVYVFHEIVHNKIIVNQFIKRGVIFVRSLDEVPDGEVLVFSAHGVSPKIVELAKQKNCKIVDATCPLVEKVHTEAKKRVQEGAHIIYIGHVGHEEVMGVQGEYSPDQMTVIKGSSEINQIPKGKSSYVVLSQTTLNSKDVQNTILEIKNKIPGIISGDTANICYATTARQVAVESLADNVDIFIILGSSNSSNANRLREIAATKVDSYLVDTIQEIEECILENATNIGISSGASTPEELIQDGINYLSSKYGVCIVEKKVKKESQIEK